MALGTVNGGNGSLFGRRTRRERGKWPGEKGDQHGLHVSWARGWEEGGVDTAKQEVAARARALAALPLPTGRGTGRLAGASWAGRLAGPQVRPGKCSAFSIFCLFLFFF